MSIVRCHESHYVGVLDNPQSIWTSLGCFLRRFLIGNLPTLTWSRDSAEELQKRS